ARAMSRNFRRRKQMPLHRASTEQLEPRLLLAVVRAWFYEDVNHNARHEYTEGNLAGRIAYLDLINNSALDPDEPSALSGADGIVAVSTTATAPYNLRQILPNGWTASGPDSYVIQADQLSYTQWFGSFVTGSTVP